jgi:hypothetical protein
MRRAALLLVLLGAIVGTGLFAYSINSSESLNSTDALDSSYRTDVSDSRSTDTERERVVADMPPSGTLTQEQGEEQWLELGEESTSPAIASATVARWIDDASGDNSAKRAAAISALGTVPKSLAVPVLQKVISTGGDGDRQQALTSLRTLALNQGDADSVIRDTLRLTVYDGDDYMVADAQAALEEIEHNLGEGAHGLR